MLKFIVNPGGVLHNLTCGSQGIGITFLCTTAALRAIMKPTHTWPYSKEVDPHLFRSTFDLESSVVTTERDTRLDT